MDANGCSLLSWASTARKDGGLGTVNIPLFSDKNHKLSKDYGVLLEEEGVALRGLFIIDPTGKVRQVWDTTRLRLPIRPTDHGFLDHHQRLACRPFR